MTRWLKVHTSYVDVAISDVALALADETSDVQAEFLNAFALFLNANREGNLLLLRSHARRIWGPLTSSTKDLLRWIGEGK